MTTDPSGWDITVGYANEFLLDRQIVDNDGVAVAKVDDLEFDVPEDGALPVLTAMLCGPTALGPRLGGRVGTWWVAVARRLRPDGNASPVAIALGDVDRITRETVQLRIAAAAAGNWRLRNWVDAKLITRIPGGS